LLNNAYQTNGLYRTHNPNANPIPDPFVRYPDSPIARMSDSPSLSVTVIKYLTSYPHLKRISTLPCEMLMLAN